MQDIGHWSNILRFELANAEYNARFGFLASYMMIALHKYDDIAAESLK